MTCSPRPGLRALADVVIAIPTGPEVLTGSTRLKAASATKAALNAITTAAMVRLGKVYGNLMVDMKQTNAKLRDRGRRIVMAAGQVEADEAARLLAEAGDMKTAIVMARLGVGAEAARKRTATPPGRTRPRRPGRAARARPSTPPPLLGGRAERSESRGRGPIRDHGRGWGACAGTRHGQVRIVGPVDEALHRRHLQFTGGQHRDAARRADRADAHRDRAHGQSPGGTARGAAGPSGTASRGCPGAWGPACCTRCAVHATPRIAIPIPPASVIARS